MAKVISVAIQKGGVGKSTITCVLAHLLSKDHKVLVIDMDGSQCNATKTLLGINPFGLSEHTVYHALLEEDARKHILKTLNENIHVLAGSPYVSTMGEYFYVQLPKRKKTHHFLLKETIKSIRDYYDYILIDGCPSLGEPMVMSLATSDFLLIPFETSELCEFSLKIFWDTINSVKKNLNPDLDVVGILRCLIDVRRKDNEYYSEKVQKDYGDLVFETIIKRSAVAGRLHSYGVHENPEIRQVEKFFKPMKEELLCRLNQK